MFRFYSFEFTQRIYVVFSIESLLEKIIQNNTRKTSTHFLKIWYFRNLQKTDVVLQHDFILGLQYMYNKVISS